MVLMSSISDVGRCCCKWVENCSRFRSSNAELGVGGHVRIGPQQQVMRLMIAVSHFPLQVFSRTLSSDPKMAAASSSDCLEALKGLVDDPSFQQLHQDTSIPIVLGKSRSPISARC
jgi:hypothetical protein